jgi:predicted RNA binding protein YcfA (HicA-like mRNA interferase family)
LKVRDVIKKIEDDGWQLARTGVAIGNTITPIQAGTVTVAGHPSAEVPPGTLNSILKQAGLK